MDLLNFIRTKRKTLVASGVGLLVATILLAMIALKSPEEDHLWKGDFASGDLEQGVQLEAGSYHVWIIEEEDPGRVQVRDQDGNLIFSKSSEDSSASIEKGENNYLKIGELEIDRTGSYTLKTQQKGTVYITDSGNQVVIVVVVSTSFLSVLLLITAGFGQKIYSWMIKKDHSLNMPPLASELGLTFYYEDPYNIPRDYSHLNLLRNAPKGHAYNILTGDYRGESVLFFDYEFHTKVYYNEQGKTTGYSSSSEGFFFSGLIIGLEKDFPELTLKPENFSAGFSAGLGSEDIDLDNLGFSRKYVVNCESKKFAYDIFHPRMMELFLEEEDLFFELEENTIIIYWEMTKTNNIPHRLELLRRIKELLPAYLFAEDTGEAVFCQVCSSKAQYFPDYEDHYCWNCNEYLGSMVEDI